MQLSRTVLCAIGYVLFGAQLALAAGHTACTDCPTAPPCSPEGSCHPKRTTWGYYQTRWTRWPTDPGDRAMAKPGEHSLLKSHLVPKPAIEDRAAPPPSDEAEEGATDAPAGAGEGPSLNLQDLPPLPPAGPLPGTPAAEPGDDGNAPPALPRIPVPGAPGVPPGLSPPPRPAPPQANRPGATDAPPQLPSGFARLLPPPNKVRQAVYAPSPQAGRNYRPTPVPNRVRPAAYHTPQR